MVNVRDTVTTKYQVDTGNTPKSLRSIGQEFRNAGTLGDKFKVASSGAMDYVSQHAAQLFAVGGAAVASFAVKALAAFEDTAKAAVDTGKAMGDSTENASRWIAVGDDYKVAADQIVAGAKEITKHLGDSKWADYKIAVEDAAGAMRPTGEVLKDILVTISAQSTAQDRQRVGMQLLGKSYAGLAPLVGHTREEYDKMLGSVEKGQVITDEEARKAEKMRLAQDALADALHEVTLKVGEEVASLAPMIPVLVKIIGLIEKIATLSPLSMDDTKTTDVLTSWTKAALASGDAMGYLTQKGLSTKAAAQALQTYAITQIEAGIEAGKTAAAVADASAAIVESGRVAARTGDQVAEATEQQKGFNHALAAAEGVVGDAKTGYQKAGTAAGNFADALDDVAEAQKRADKAVSDMNDELDRQISAMAKLRGDALSDLDAKYALQAAIEASDDALRDYNETLKDGKSTADERSDAEQAVVDAARETAKAYADSTGAAEGSKAAIDAQIASLYVQASTLAPGSPLRTRILGLITDLQGIPTSVTTKVGLGNYDDTVEKLRNVKRMLDDINRARNASLVVSPENRGNGTKRPIAQSAAPRSSASGGRGTRSTEGFVTHETTPAPVDEPAAPTAPIVADGTDPLDLARNMAKQGAITKDALRAQLSAAAAAAGQYSNEQQSLLDEIAGMDRDAADEKQRLLDEQTAAAQAAAEHEKEIAAAKAKYLYDTGQTSTDDYLANLKTQMAGLEEFSPAWIAIQTEMSTIRLAQLAAEKKAVDDLKASQDAAVAAAFSLAQQREDDLEAVKDQQAATEELARATAEYNRLAADSKATAEQRAAALKDVAAAQKALDDATIKGAGAQADLAGLTPGTPAWAEFVRKAITDYIAQNGDPTGALAASLVGVPTFQSGTGGGTTINVTFSGVVGDPARVRQQIASLISDQIRTSGDAFLRPL